MEEDYLRTMDYKLSIEVKIHNRIILLMILLNG